MNVTADPAKTRLLKAYKHSSPFVSCRFDPLGRYVFAGPQDNSVQRWEVASDKPTELKAHESWVRAIGFSPDGAATYTGGYDGRLIWWETAAESPHVVRTVAAHDGWLRALAVSPDGQLLATCGNDLVVKLWSAADGSLVRELAGHGAHVYNVAFHPTGEQLASCDLKGVVRHWSLTDGKELRQFIAADLHKYDTTFLADIGGARCMAFSVDGKTLACGGITNVTNAFAGVGNPAVVCFDFEKGEKTLLHKPKANVNGVAWGLAWHPQGFLICAAGGGGGGWLYFYKPGESNEFYAFKLPSPARDLALHSDGLRLAVAHFDSHVRLYTMEPAAT